LAVKRDLNKLDVGTDPSIQKLADGEASCDEHRGAIDRSRVS
jgi:hypothetical protein